jgi:hypothetical protein
LPLIVLAVGSLTPPARAADADHLILSEVVIRANRAGSPFIEIVNPTAGAIDMSAVYLTDGATAPSTFYYNITLADPAAANPGGGNGGDFHGRFPDGYTLAAGDTLVVSVNGSADYQAAYGKLPDFELFEDALTPDDVPELVEVFPGSINAGLGGGTNVPALSEVAESLILYTWDGASDLVQDLDYLTWGTNTSVRIDKTGVTIGAGTYLADTPIASQVPVAAAAHNDGDSFMRVSADEGTETLTGGNGLTGHDETSENLNATWANFDGQEPADPAAVPHPSAPIVTEAKQTPPAPYVGLAANLSATVVTSGTVATAEFKYTVDGGAPVTLTAADQGAGVWTATIPAQSLGAVVVWWAEVTNSGGGQVVYPAGGIAYAATYTVGEAPEPGDGPAKLLLTEICTLGSDQEFIEIHNPLPVEVDLSDFYLTDAIFATGGQFYWRIAEGNPQQTTVGGGAFADFHARFPDGFVIAAGDTIVISIPGSGSFSGEFGFLPDLELYEDDPFPDNVPDMRYVFGDDTNNSIITRTGANTSNPSLTNGGETVILYHWLATEDKVTDIDIFAWKDPGSTTTSYFFNKTGVTIGSHTYLPETGTAEARAYPLQADFGFSYHRIDPTEGSQAISGSNGVDGRDETSEDMQNTFDLLEWSPSNPGGGGGPGEGGTATSIQLLVEARTFLPTVGERFPIKFVSRPDSETRLRIFDMEGRLVVNLFDSRFDGAPSTIPENPTRIDWDGRSSTFELVKGGMYIVHLSVVGITDGEEDNKTAPVVVGTRLSN